MTVKKILLRQNDDFLHQIAFKYLKGQNKNFRQDSLSSKLERVLKHKDFDNMSIEDRGTVLLAYVEYIGEFEFSGHQRVGKKLSDQRKIAQLKALFKIDADFGKTKGIGYLKKNIKDAILDFVKKN